jgi:hypothetical protein
MSPSLRSVGRRLLRATASALCLLSLLLCLAACWLWVRSQSPEPFVASLASAGRTHEVRSRDGRLSVLRIDGERPAPGVSYPPGNTISAASWALIAVAAPPPPVKSGFAGVEVERGQLQALEGTAPTWPANAALTLLTAAQSPQNSVIFNGHDGRLTLRQPQVTTSTLLADQLIYDRLDSGLIRVPTPLMAVRVTVPYRVIAATTALLPALWLALTARGLWTARRLARRRRSGLCTDCGYDLRGTPGAARCPECGRDLEAAR